MVVAGLCLREEVEFELGWTTVLNYLGLALIGWLERSIGSYVAAFLDSTYVLSQTSFSETFAARSIRKLMRGRLQLQFPNA